MKFEAQFITYQGVYQTIATEKLNLPTKDGRRTILSNHMPVMIPIDVGVIETKEEDGLQHYAIGGGVLYFKDNVAKIVSDHIQDVRNVDIVAIEKEKQDAQMKIEQAKREYEKIYYQERLDLCNNLLASVKKHRLEE